MLNGIAVKSECLAVRIHLFFHLYIALKSFTIILFFLSGFLFPSPTASHLAALSLLRREMSGELDLWEEGSEKEPWRPGSFSACSTKNLSYSWWNRFLGTGFFFFMLDLSASIWGRRRITDSWKNEEEIKKRPDPGNSLMKGQESIRL